MGFGMKIRGTNTFESIANGEEYLLAFADEAHPRFLELHEAYYDSPRLDPATVVALAREFDEIVQALMRDGARAWPDHERVGPTERNVRDAIAAFTRWRDFFRCAAAQGAWVSTDSD